MSEKIFIALRNIEVLLNDLSVQKKVWLTIKDVTAEFKLSAVFYISKLPKNAFRITNPMVSLFTSSDLRLSNGLHKVRSKLLRKLKRKLSTLEWRLVDMENNHSISNAADTAHVDLNEAFAELQSNQLPANSVRKQQSSHLETLFETSQELKKRKSGKIEFQEPIIHLGKAGIVYRNTITLIQGPAGAHKSRLAQGICSLILSKKEKPFLNFERKGTRLNALCYLDTERNIKDQLPFALQQIQLNAGYRAQEHPENFYYTSLISIPRECRLECLEAYVENLRNSINKHLLLVVDVVTDVIADFNNVGGSLSCLDWMNRMINEHDISFLVLIHENPGSEKARGHMGTELLNKVTTAIQIAPEKDEDGIYKVKFLKTRNSKQPERFYVRYGEKEKDLVIVPDDEVNESKAKKVEAPIHEIVPLLAEWLKEDRMASKELMARLLGKFGTSERIIRERLSSVIKDTLVVSGSGNDRVYLNREQEGREVFYFLK